MKFMPTLPVLLKSDHFRILFIPEKRQIGVFKRCHL